MENKNQPQIEPISPDLPVLRWVTADKRMPPVGEFCGKCEGKPAKIKNEMEGGNYLIANGNIVSPRYVEWLEETTVPVQAPHKTEGEDYDKWHPQDYSGKNEPAPSPVIPDKGSETNHLKY